MNTSPPCINDLRSALAAGNEEAFGQLLTVAGPRLRRAALRMLASRSDADDALQEVLVGLVTSRHRLLHVEDLNAYMFASLVRVANRLMKRQRRQPTSLESLDQIAQRSVADAASVDEEALNNAVQRLPEKQREVIVLKTDAQMTFASIASLLGISLNTAASRYRYGLEKLRSELRREAC